MSLQISLDELMTWTGEERAKWLPWLKANPKALDVIVATGTYPLSPRKLLFHMALHEVRHWAQIAAAVRAAGFAPPGDHDLFYSKALV